MSTRAEIHDLGYRRYSGPRRPASTRWRVIMRHQMRYTWKTWWRYKVQLILALMVTATCAALIYFIPDQMVGGFDEAGNQMSMRDFILPAAFSFYCPIAFLLSLTTGAGTVSGDSKSGAFVFYFARSTRPIDYALGRFAGLCLMIAPLMLGMPLILAFTRLGLSDTGEQALNNLWVVPKVLLLGALGTAAYAAVPLAFSALGSGRGLTIGLWAGWYMLGAGIVGALGLFVWQPIACLDIATALKQASASLFHLIQQAPRHRDGPDPLVVPAYAALSMLAAMTVGSLAFVTWKLKAKQADVGGGS